MDDENSLIKKIFKLLEEMEHLTTKFAKVPSSKFEIYLVDIEFYVESELATLHLWLRRVHQTTFSILKNVYLMPPNPELTWDRYELHGIEGLQEQALMTKAAKALREDWIRPYKVNIARRRKKKENEKESTK